MTFEVSIQEATVTAVIDVLKNQVVINKKWVRAADLLRADGVTSSAMEDKDFRSEFKKMAVIPSFTKVEQTILDKPVTALSDEEKVTRRWVQQQVGSRYALVQKYLRKAEEEASMSDEDMEARRVASLAARLERDLTKWVERIERAEDLPFDAVKMNTALKQAIALLK